MRSKERSLLLWILFVVVVFSPIYGLKGSASQPLTAPLPNLEAAPPKIPKETPVIPPPAPVSSQPRSFPPNPPNVQPSNTGLAQSATHSAQNTSFHSPAISPALIASAVGHGQRYGVPVAAPSKELSSHLYPVNRSSEKGFSPAIVPVPPEVKETSTITKGPLVSPSHSSGSSPVMSPVPHEGKQHSNITDAPLPSHPGLSGSPPVISPIPHDMKPTSNAHAPVALHLQPSGSSPGVNPMPHAGRTLNNTLSPLPSNTHPSESSPGISPAPPEVNSSSNTRYAPFVSHLQPSGPVTSPTAPAVKEPSNTTHSPLPSHPLPSESSPMTSPTPPKVKEPSNTTHSPLPSHPLPSKFSPMTSPTSPEVKEPSNTTLSPLPSHPLPLESSPARSPIPPAVKEPSNTTHSRLPSHPLPSETSPAMSPVPHEVTDPSNNTHAPLASQPKPSGLSPVMSPIPHAVEEPSNVTHSPLPSHSHPSETPPVISPAPHEVKDPSNTTHAPLASDPKPSRISPMISPTPHEVKDPSNITHSPLPSHPPPPEFSLVPAPHKWKDPSNITNAPLASQPKPSGSAPAMGPTPHEVKEPSNATVSPLPLHPLPSQSSPMISPAPHEGKEPSNITHSPLPLPPHSSEYSPAVSPVPHGVKDQSNATHAPLASHHHPSLSSPLLSPMPHEVKNPSNITHAPFTSHPHPPPERIQTPALAPKIPQHGARIRVGNPAVAPLAPSPPSSHPGPMISPVPSQIPAVSPSNRGRQHTPHPYVQAPSVSPIQAPSHPPVVVPKNNQRNHAPSPYLQAPSLSPIQAPFPSTKREVAHTPSPSLVIPSRHNKGPIQPPILPPGFSRSPRTPPPKPVWAFPPPPPNSDCKSLSCQEPNTYPPPGSLCVCVLPIKVGLRLNIALYTFFPLVSELAQEIASGIFVKQSQVRIMGANAASEDPEKTIVLIALVPLGRSFDMNTALLIYERFWHKQVLIKASYFGDYDVLYVLYPGLPPSPPMAPGDVSDDGGTLANGENARTIKPLAVNVKKKKQKLSGSVIAIIVLACVIALFISVGAAWLLLLKRRNRSRQLPSTSQQPLSPLAKPSGTGLTNLGSGPSSTSASFASSIAAHTGTTKTFSLAEVERATDRFHETRIIGEGGFGRVYQGTLEDGTMVAVKVLKRDDQQGGREFLAEVEMLGRLHHRNLVKLIGICTEENVRCLVYELIPNGSVESHLHGLDKETSPLDWNARMKIALGAARGLAYLHEDSSPRVIHRDFKSSNILLEHDFTPKVSDFGLARTALDEGDHISTRVMGTFGYVAPEYAMTGHLLVKSDVYSYGVVLLELLTGRKPVDMLQPPGQENLVNWARPLLTSMDGLEKMIDPALGTDISLDSVAKVAAIASMCVQPEVSHRPFMGEVVQALKLVCSESDEHRRSCSQDESSTKDSDIRISTGSGHEEERVLSESDIFCTPATFAKDASGSFRRYSSSGPLKRDRSQKLWERARGFSSGSMIAHRSGSGLEGGEHWP